MWSLEEGGEGENLLENKGFVNPDLSLSVLISTWLGLTQKLTCQKQTCSSSCHCYHLCYRVCECPRGPPGLQDLSIWSLFISPPLQLPLSAWNKMEPILRAFPSLEASVSSPSEG